MLIDKIKYFIYIYLCAMLLNSSSKIPDSSELQHPNSFREQDTLSLLLNTPLVEDLYRGK